MTRQARAHVQSARTLAESDPQGAIALCHDAVRKAIDAHACSNGYRFENTQGAHKHAIDYARSSLADVVTDAVFDEVERLKNVRHATEYGTQPAKVDAAEVRRFADVAEEMVSKVVAAIAPPPQGTGPVPPG